MSRASIGIVINPRSGSDVRRLMTSAGSSTVDDKISIVRRLLDGSLEGGADRVLLTRDPFGIGRRASEARSDRDRIEFCDFELGHGEADSAEAARRMRESGCRVVVTLGGDGTNRAVALGWRDAPIVPLSTGTNNAFPSYIEPTVAGAAAGLIAAGRVELDEVSSRAKLVDVRVDGGEAGRIDDLALIDAVAVDDPYVGSLELFDPETMRVAVMTRANPAAVGLSSIGGHLHPCHPDDDAGVAVWFASTPAEGTARTLRVPTAPGHYDDVVVSESRRLELGEVVTIEGPTILAFDGERSRRLRQGERAQVAVVRDGPVVIDVDRVMAKASARGVFLR